MKKLLVILLVGLNGCEKIPATKKECTDVFTLAQAVVDRDLQWNQILVCE